VLVSLLGIRYAVDCELGDGIGAIASSSRTRRTCNTMQSDAHVMQRGGGGTRHAAARGID